MSMPYPRRLIEVDLPIRRISAHARREKSIRHGHISTLHIWWARRPLAACRAVICASLWPDPADPLCPQGFRDAAAGILSKFAESVYNKTALHASASVESFGQWEGIVQASREGLAFDTTDPVHLNKLRFALLDFIADFANWDNSTVPEYLEASRALTQAAHESLGGAPGTRPLVVDPFAGGGSIPLEALRVGADAFASDLNPIPVLLNKTILEHIPKFGYKLLDEIKKWGDWIHEYAAKELGNLYPNDEDGSSPVAYLWSRIIVCEGPGCGAEVPLLRSLWLAKKANQSVALVITVDSLTKRISLSINSEAAAADVSEGTVRRGSVACPVCGYTTPVGRVRAQSKEKGPRQICFAKLVNTPEGNAVFRLPTTADQSALIDSKARARELGKGKADGSSYIPNEPVSTKPHSVNRLPMYGLKTWGDVYGDRQKVVLSTYSEGVREVYRKISDPGLAEATSTLLALTVGKMADYLSTLCVWRTARSCVAHAFGRQALPFTSDFGEMNPFAQSAGDWSEATYYLELFIKHMIIAGSHIGGNAIQSDASEEFLPDDSADLFVTDPPYYDAVPYADLSDVSVH